MWQSPNPLEKGRLPVHDASMTEKHPQRPRDLNQWAKHMVDLATGEANDREPTMTEVRASKGGIKGGPARAAALTAEQRSDIAKKAAGKRWANKA